MRKKWRTVVLLSIAECLGMALWFSVSAVVPVLMGAWRLTPGDAAWITMTVQIGFVFGALLSALFNLSDLYPEKFIIAAGLFAGAAANAVIALDPGDFRLVLALRFCTGAALALVYPVGMKILSTWMKKDRGLGLGILVGALTVGNASPHVLRVFGAISNWQQVLWIATLLAVAGGVIVLLWIRPGPHQTPSPPFRWRYLGESVRQRGVRLANFGYLGHMWELYAMWTWIPLFLLASFEAHSGGDGGPSPKTSVLASIVAFLAIAAGGIGSYLAGYLADRWGRTRTTIASLVISGLCAATIGFAFGKSPLLVSVIAILWGFAVVADSAQYSSSVSELCEPGYMGTALTMQTSLGFLLTLFSIRLLPDLMQSMSWRWAFATLAAGPAFGIWAMWRLKGSEEAKKLAGGRG